MINKIEKNIVLDVKTRIAKSINRTIWNFREGYIETEPTFTDRLLANIVRDFEDHNYSFAHNNFIFRARTLKDRGRNSAESKYGADYCIILNIDLSDYKVTKGILSQAKILNRYEKINFQYMFHDFLEYKQKYNSYLEDESLLHDKTGGLLFYMNSQKEWDNLKMQCEKMLKISRDSYVSLYTKEDVFIIPAIAVVSFQKQPFSSHFYCKNLVLFFEEFIKCFVGDFQLTGASDVDFENLIETSQARTLLELTVSDRQ